MEPTYKDQEYILTSPLAIHLSSIKRGEVVIIQSPKNQNLTLVTRIIGLPGETITINANGAISINQQILDESSYLPPNTKTYGSTFLRVNEPKIIPPNQYAVLRDNRQFSSDSGSWGFVSKENIISSVLFCYANCR